MSSSAAAQLRKARAKSQLTPDEMATFVDITPERYRAIESGGAVPTRPESRRIHLMTLDIGVPVPPDRW